MRLEIKKRGLDILSEAFVEVRDEEFGIGATFFNRLNIAVSNNNLQELEQIYVDLSNEFFTEEFIFVINPLI